MDLPEPIDCIPLRNSRVRDLRKKLWAFVHDHAIPAEFQHEQYIRQEQDAGRGRFRSVPPVVEQLKSRARAEGLWNLFLPKHFRPGPGLSNAEYAPLAEVMGRGMLASEACNCSAPDTGNMEVLIKYGSAEQKKRWLEPLLAGQIRSAFLMTEPAVASSDARNVCTDFRR